MAGTASRQGAPASFMDQFDGNFGALVAAAKVSNTFIKQLVATTMTRYNQIAASITDLKLALTTTTTPTPRGTRSPFTSERDRLHIRVNQLQAATKGKWVKGRFFSTNVHGVYEGHDSGHCNFEGRGHVRTTTRNNPEGPGKEKNKGWDAFLL